MKNKIIAIVLLVVMMFVVAGCSEKKVMDINGVQTIVPYHGLGNTDIKRDDVNYQLSGWNIFLSVIFVETVFVPIIVLCNQLYEPVSQKAIDK